MSKTPKPKRQKYMYLHVKVAYLERDDADQNPEDKEQERYDEPDDTPHFLFF